MTDVRYPFLDLDRMRAWDTGLMQRFHRPEKVPITGLEPGPAGSWDARMACIYGSVLKEDGRFRMWYGVMPDAGSHAEEADHYLSAYAESEDGVTWRKPDLGLTGQQQYPGNNLLPLPGVPMGVVPAPPETGAKYLTDTIITRPLDPGITDQWGFTYRGNGTYFFLSDDGLRWRQITLDPVVQEGDVACLVYDPFEQRYLCYQKIAALHGLDTRRAFAMLESRDGVHWEGDKGEYGWYECFIADDYDDLLAMQAGKRITDHYAIAVYPVRPNFYVAVESLFFIGSPLRFVFSQNPYGIASTRLGFSHDGITWRHPKGRPAWMGLGEPGDFDAGFMVTANTFTEHGDDLLLYYGAVRYEHGWYINQNFTLRKDIPLSEQRDMVRIGVARIKQDRFASLAALYASRFDVYADVRKGEELYVNA
ncbi:MAG: hypothetical protein ACYC6A_00005, partial [Armatimonadota bacterium]